MAAPPNQKRESPEEESLNQHHYYQTKEWAVSQRWIGEPTQDPPFTLQPTPTETQALFCALRILLYVKPKCHYTGLSALEGSVRILLDTSGVRSHLQPHGTCFHTFNTTTIKIQNQPS